MKRILFALVLLALAGCGERSEIEDAVRARLKDPSSAQFGTLVFLTPSRSHACIEVNAKNSLGGYVGTKIMQLQKSNGIWEVTSFDQVASNCKEF